MRRRLLLPAVVAAALLTVAGCGNGGGTDETGGTDGGGPTATASPEATPSDSETADAPGSANVPDALKFSATTVDGKPFDGMTLAGKPTVLWFWAPWCPKCRAQAPETAKVAEAFDGKVNVVGVAGLDKPAAMKDFVASTKIDGFPNLTDEPGGVWKKFKIAEQSTYVLLDKDGKTVFTGNLPAGKGLADKVGKLVG
ncbi:redoxin domain-containing protein [Streptomyces sp. KR80]|uniref:redoxin domain-containing protein n=1 Tax=Streptomyces sp. KR80 TaxID=3457426 RepID=UPI003FD2C81E